MFQTKVAGEIKAQIIFSVTFPENRGVCETIRNNIVQPCRPQKKIK
jgi:hypothetical protein